ncbi:hypothetical protein OF83DRAFT_1246447 [Amylostereum chailletii]|nr:hypothetical protein OF83DRAFT_1246447 [Amylostereum chailletii]
MSAGKVPWGQITVMTVGLMGLGYGLLKTTVPTPDETYAAMSPDLKRKVDANRAARLAVEEGVKRQQEAQVDPDSAKPVWADSKRS